MDVFSTSQSVEDSGKHGHILQTLTYIGLILSFLSVVGTMVIYLIFKKDLLKERSKYSNVHLSQPFINVHCVFDDKFLF
jgi:hypothetical protein